MVSRHDADEVFADDAEDEAGFLPPVSKFSGIFAAELEFKALQGVVEAVARVSHRSFLFSTLIYRVTIALQSCYYGSCLIDLETCLVSIPRYAAGGKKFIGYRYSLSLLAQCQGLQQWSRLYSLLSCLNKVKPYRD